METAWEARFNQEGPPSPLGDAKVRLLILPQVHAWRIGPALVAAFRLRVCRRIACSDAWICISFVHVGVRSGVAQLKRVEVIFCFRAGRLEGCSSNREIRMTARSRQGSNMYQMCYVQKGARGRHAQGREGSS